MILSFTQLSRLSIKFKLLYWSAIQLDPKQERKVTAIMSTLIVDLSILFNLQTSVHLPRQYNPWSLPRAVGGFEFDLWVHETTIGHHNHVVANTAIQIFGLCFKKICLWIIGNFTPLSLWKDLLPTPFFWNTQPTRDLIFAVQVFGKGHMYDSTVQNNRRL